MTEGNINDLLMVLTYLLDVELSFSINFLLFLYETALMVKNILHVNQNMVAWYRLWPLKSVISRQKTMDSMMMKFRMNKTM